jgi:hypothetical protein
MSLSVFPNFAEDVDAIEQFSMKLYNPQSFTNFSLSVLSQSEADFPDGAYIPIENQIPPPTFNGKYENSQFNAVINVVSILPTIEGEAPGTLVLNNIELVAYSVDCQGFSAKKSGNTIEVTGSATLVFTDAVYQFLMPDLTVRQLPLDTTEDFISIVRWQPPNTKIRTITHQFTISTSYVENGVNRNAILTLVIPQTIQWNFNSGVQSFRQILSRSRRV